MVWCGTPWVDQRDASKISSVCQSKSSYGCGCRTLSCCCFLSSLLLAIVVNMAVEEMYLWIEDRPGSVVWVGQMEVLKAKTDGFLHAHV